MPMSLLHKVTITSFQLNVKSILTCRLQRSQLNMQTRIILWIMALRTSHPILSRICWVICALKSLMVITQHALLPIRPRDGFSTCTWQKLLSLCNYSSQQMNSYCWTFAVFNLGLRLVDYCHVLYDNSLYCSDVVLEYGSVLASDSSTYFEDLYSDSNPRTRLDSRYSGIGLSTVWLGIN